LCFSKQRGVGILIKSISAISKHLIDNKGIIGLHLQFATSEAYLGVGPRQGLLSLAVPAGIVRTLLHNLLPDPLKVSTKSKLPLFSTGARDNTSEHHLDFDFSLSAY